MLCDNDLGTGALLTPTKQVVRLLLQLFWPSQHYSTVYVDNATQQLNHLNLLSAICLRRAGLASAAGGLRGHSTLCIASTAAAAAEGEGKAKL